MVAIHRQYINIFLLFPDHVARAVVDCIDCLLMWTTLQSMQAK